MKIIKALACASRTIFFHVESSIFELNCPVCGKRMSSALDDPLCRHCMADIVSTPKDHACQLCGNLISHGQEVCGVCSFHPPFVQRFWAYGNYDGAMKELIKAYKYGRVTRLRSILVQLLNECYRKDILPLRLDAVVIVPKFKPAWKRFYPMKQIAGQFCRSNRLPFLFKAVVKKKETPRQASLLGKARLKNLIGTLAVRPGMKLDGLNLLLLDDVSTTGTTVRSMAEVLHRAGAKVWVLVIAKAR